MRYLAPGDGFRIRAPITQAGRPQHGTVRAPAPLDPRSCQRRSAIVLTLYSADAILGG